MDVRRRDLAIVAALVAAILGALIFAVASARGDVGVTSASRDAGRAGTVVRLRLDCGFCFPPCRGPQGHRHPAGFAKGPCMLDGGKAVPRSFAISLLPLPRAERLLSREIRHHRLCPRPTAAPHHRPFTFLGNATPPPGGNNPENGDPPRYLLKFRIPRLPAGDYSYVIWCDACIAGPAGSLIVDPSSTTAQLRVLPWAVG